MLCCKYCAKEIVSSGGCGCRDSLNFDIASQGANSATCEAKLDIAVSALREIEDLMPVNERDRRRISREALAKLEKT